MTRKPRIDWKKRAEELEKALREINEVAHSDGTNVHERMGAIFSIAQRAVGGEYQAEWDKRDTERWAQSAAEWEKQRAAMKANGPLP